MASIALLALLALQADISSRVRVTGAASLVFAALLPQAAAVAAPVGPPAGAALASVAEMRAAVLQRGSRLDRTESSQAALDALLDGYVAAHPVDAPARNCAGALARGSWRVMHAPHIEKLGATLGARFDVRYEFDDGDAIRSDVRYTGLWGEGWLSTRGRWSAADDDTVRLSWDEIWWSPGASDAPAADPPAGALGAAVQALGRAGMLEQFAVFPVELLDAQVVSFRFAATNSRIVAAKVGPSPARLK